MSSIVVRAIRDEDRSPILRLNEASVHFTSPLDDPSLRELLGMTAFGRVAEIDGELVAFLIALREGTAYESPNYRWFERRGGSFVYVDRIVVDDAARGNGVASRLYDDVIAFTTASGVESVVCEVDADPPNPVSQRFHVRYGFVELDTHVLPSGKRVSLQELRITRPSVGGSPEVPNR